ncbi:hypothetical protein ISCGN_026836 [Ixodes scapularis]
MAEPHPVSSGTLEKFSHPCVVRRGDCGGPLPTPIGRPRSYSSSTNQSSESLPLHQKAPGSEREDREVGGPEADRPVLHCGVVPASRKADKYEFCTMCAVMWERSTWRLAWQTPILHRFTRASEPGSALRRAGHHWQLTAKTTAEIDSGRAMLQLFAASVAILRPLSMHGWDGSPLQSEIPSPYRSGVWYGVGDCGGPLPTPIGRPRSYSSSTNQSSESLPLHQKAPGSEREDREVGGPQRLTGLSFTGSVVPGTRLKKRSLLFSLYDVVEVLCRRWRLTWQTPIPPRCLNTASCSAVCWHGSKFGLSNITMSSFCFDLLTCQEMRPQMGARRRVTAGGRRALGPAISGGTTTVDMLGTPGVSGAMHSSSTTADGTENPSLEVLTQSSLTARRAETSNFVIRTNFMDRFRAPNACTVLYFEPRIVCDHETDGHATRNYSKKVRKTIVKMAKNEVELTKQERVQADHYQKQTTQAATAGETEEESAPRAEKSRPSQ